MGSLNRAEVSNCYFDKNDAQYPVAENFETLCNDCMYTSSVQRVALLRLFCISSRMKSTLGSGL